MRTGTTEDTEDSEDTRHPEEVEGAEGAAPVELIVVTGAPGAGKSEAARRLIDRCPRRAALIDLDAIAAVHPWRIDPAFHRLQAANLRRVAEGYVDWGARVLVIAGVVEPTGLAPALDRLTTSLGASRRLFALRADAETLAARVRADGKHQDAEQRLRWRHLDGVCAALPGAESVETGGRSLAAVVDALADRLGWPPPAEARPTPVGGGAETDLAGAGAATRARVEVPLAEVRRVARACLIRRGAAPAVADRVVEPLLWAEAEGHPSHGLLRLPDYAARLERGSLDPEARPTVTALGAGVRRVEGERVFGALAADALRRALLDGLAEGPVAVAGLRDGAHLGRLAHIVEPIARAGFLCLGGANFRGRGRLSPPFGGAEGRLSTNPLAFAAPADGAPFVLDMTTTAVAEGKVRARVLADQPVPDGWLAGPDGAPVRDGRRLYADPPRALLAPLGAGLGYKGTGLALMIEILAAVLTGSGFVARPAPRGGNAAVFIGLRPEVLGRAPADVLADTRRLLDAVAGCPPLPGHTVRLPGARSIAGRRRVPESVSIPAGLWDALRASAGVADGPRDSDEREAQ